MPAPAGNKVNAFLRLVMIEHSVFALPFAYIAALTAMRPTIDWLTLLVITIAMVSARTVAMAANRIIDRRLDALNPRTAQRELVTGAVSLRTAVTGLVVALAIFLASAAALNTLCLLLSPVALFLLTIYSYAKRFTDFPQFFLGLAQAIAPLGAWLGVTGHWSWPAFVLGLAVGSWIGGFDLIYACQDVDVDRRIGVRSVPVRFGVRASLYASSAVHLATFGLYAAFGAMTHYHWLWYVGLVLVGGTLAYEHAIVRTDDLSRVNRAFFTANGVIGVVLFAFAVADLTLLQDLR